MAFNVGQIEAGVSADTGPFMRSINKVFVAGDRVGTKVAQSFDRVGDAFMRVGSTLSMAVTAPLIGAGALAIKTAADYESLRQSMDILNGSVEEGARNFERLKRFSATTPFQLKDLARAQNTLQGFGQSADDAFESISMIGDIAAVTQGDIQAIAVAFGQAAAEGKLLSRDIRQLINQGVPATKLLAESMGVATSEIFDMASEGKITFDVLKQAFREATSEGGLFADGMKKQSQTIAGLFSTLKDNVSISLAEIGDAIVEELNLKELVKDIIFRIRTITAAFRAMSSESKMQLLRVAGALMAGGPLLVALGVTAKAIAGFVKLVTSKFGLITVAVGGVVAAGRWLYDNWSEILKEMSNQMASWAAATKNVFSFVAKTASFFGRALPGAMQGYWTAIDKSIMVLQGLNVQSQAEFTSLTESGKRAFGNLSSFVWQFAKQLTGSSLDAFLKTLNGLMSESAFWAEELRISGSQFGATVAESMLPATGSLASKMVDLGHNLSVSEVAMGGLKHSASGTSQVMNFLGQRIGEAFAQAIVFTDKLTDALKNLAKQLASRAIVNFLGMAFSGGLGGLFSGSFFGKGGGLSKLLGFDTGGVVPGPKGAPRLAVVHGQESVFTPDQMNSLGRPQQSINPAVLEAAFSRALAKHTTALGPEELYIITQKGRLGI